MICENTAEMILKISTHERMKQTPTLEHAVLRYYLYSFPYTCKVLNRETSNRIDLRDAMFNDEVEDTLKDFLHRTIPHQRFNYKSSWYKLDKILLGDTNWKDNDPELNRYRVQRFLIWA